MTYTLEELQQARDEMASTAQANVTKLEQATEAMARGKVGQRGLYLMGELVDLAVALHQDLDAAQEGLTANQNIADARARVPDAGDNAWLMDD